MVDTPAPEIDRADPSTLLSPRAGHLSVCHSKKKEFRTREERHARHVGSIYQRHAGPRQRAHEVQAAASASDGGVLRDSLRCGGRESGQAAVFLGPAPRFRPAPDKAQGWLEER